jgi:hypothetical protein
MGVGILADGRAIAKNSLIQPLGFHPAEGPGSEGVHAPPRLLVLHALEGLHLVTAGVLAGSHFTKSRRRRPGAADRGDEFFRTP